MNTRLKNAITIIFLVLGIGAMYFILREHSITDILNTYKNFNPLVLLFYILSLIILMLVLTWRWDVILKSRKIKIPFRKLFIYRIIGTSINFITPGPRVGGEPTQASLMTKHNVDFTEGLSTIMIDKIIDTTTSGILFIMGVLLVGLKYSFPRNTEIALIIGGVSFLTIIAIFYYRMLTSQHFFLRLFKMLRLDRIRNKTWMTIERKIEEIELMMIHFYKHNKRAFIATLAISILSWVVMFFEYKFATTLLGINIGVVEIFFIVSFIGIAVLFPIPMAVGVLEAGQLSAFAIINLSASAAIALAFLVRVKDIIWSLIGLILLATYGFHITTVVSKKYKNKNVDIGQAKRNKIR
jgi:uncharacterized protein (TIRG00374 family)